MILKLERLYDLVFKAILNLLTNTNEFNLEIETIVTDQEKELINSIKKNFQNIQRIYCLFHYKHDMLKNKKI